MMCLFSVALLFVVITTAQQQSDTQECFGINSGVDFSPGSHDLYSKTGTELSECCALCKSKMACQAFVWSKSSRTCWLKSATGPRKINFDRISGYSRKRNTDPSEHCLAIKSGIDYSPGSHDIQDMPGTDLAGCCNFCNSVPHCRAFVWSNSGNTCWLKSTNSGMVASDDRISGLRGIASPTTEPATSTVSGEVSGESLIACEYAGRHVTEVMLCKSCAEYVSHEHCCSECYEKEDENAYIK